MGIARFLAGFFSPARAESGGRREALVPEGVGPEGIAFFESGAVPVAMACEAIGADPARGRAVTAIRDLLSAIPKASKSTFVDRVVNRFVLTVMDLPASEKNHHARAWGLLDHSLEVAQVALERAQDRRFPATHDPVANHELQPRWTYAVFLSALLHDVGKACDVEVCVSGGVTWNPFLEPLAAYLLRHELTPGQALESRVKHRVGRGVDAHLLHNPYFWSTVVPLEARAYLGPVQSQLLLQQSEAYALLKDLVGQADKLSSIRGARRVTSLAIRRDPTQAVALLNAPAAAIVPVVAVASATPVSTVPAPAEPAAAAAPAPERRGDAPVGPVPAVPPVSAAAASTPRSPRPLFPVIAKTPLIQTVAESLAAPPTPKLSPPTTPPPSAPLKPIDLGVDGVTILTDIKHGLARGGLFVNDRRADVLLTEAHAYVIVPIAIEKICATRRYKVQFAVAPNLYLGALGAHPLVERSASGDVLHPIYLYPSSCKVATALRINLAGWLSREEIDRYGVAREQVVAATPAERARRDAVRMARREAS